MQVAAGVYGAACIKSENTVHNAVNLQGTVFFMRNTYNNKWKAAEIALLSGLAAVLVWGAMTLYRQDTLQEKLVRLHVIANSDSAADQEMKLRARDAVLEKATVLLEQSADREEALARLCAALPELETAARNACGGAYPVCASLEMAEFPQKEYDGFALPAGEYLALRVVIGEGAGRNWWCVVYPPLCTASCTEWEDTALRGGMDTEEVKLIAEQEGYVLKFRTMELWERLRQWMGK